MTIDVVLPNSNLIEGRVRKPDGTPLARLAIIAHMGAGQAGQVVGESDQSGAFRLVGFEPGCRVVAFGMAEGLSDSYRVTVARHQAPILVVRGDGEVKLSVEGGTPPLEVWLSLTGPYAFECDPISGDWVKLMANERHLLVKLPAGKRCFRAQDGSRATASGDCQVPATGVTEFRLALEPATEVQGVVEDDVGVAIADATVIAWGNDASRAAQTTTDAAGTFSVVVESGSAITIRVMIPEASLDYRRRLSPEDRKYVKFVVPAMRRSMQVVTPTQTPLVGWLVTLSSDGDTARLARPWTTNGDGRVRLPARTTTPRVINVRAPYLRAWPPAVTLTDDADGDLVAIVPLDKWGSVRGRAQGESAVFVISPLGGGGTLELRPESGFVVSPKVPAGEYWLSARHPATGYCRIKSFRVEEGETTDLGDFAFSVGFLSVELTGSDTDLSDVRVNGSGERGEGFGVQYAATRWPLEVPCGKWDISLSGAFIAPYRTQIDVKEGRTCTLRHETNQATPVWITASFPSVAEAADVSLEMMSPPAKAARHEVANAERGSSDVHWRGALALGDWTITATCSDGRRQSIERRVGLQPGGSPIIVNLSLPGSWPATGEPVHIDFTSSAVAKAGGGRVPFEVMSMSPPTATFAGIAWGNEKLLESSRVLPPGDYAVVVRQLAPPVFQPFRVEHRLDRGPVVVVVK